MKIHTPALVVGFLMVVVAASPLFANEAEDAALEVAESWLALVDAGQYGESWDQAAEVFKSAITRKKWEKALGQIRQPLGDLESRKIDSVEFKASLPGAPDGAFVVIHFTSIFGNKESTVERVTPTKESDGVWRVAGYFIK